MKEFEVITRLKADNNFVDLHIDSRRVKTGDIFVAIPGQNSDGREYIPQAIKNGAKAVIYEAIAANIVEEPGILYIAISDLADKIAAIAAQYYSNPGENLTVVGVTGTNGKSSIVHYIAQFLRAKNIACGVLGTLGNGVFPNLEHSNLTTSDCCEIQRTLASFKQEDVKFVALEASSHALVQGRLDSISFDSAIFTNLSQDHLDYHGTMHDYFMAKVRLFTDYKPKKCIVNLDNYYSNELLIKISHTSKVITYSLHDPKADFYLQSDELSTPSGKYKLDISLVGEFNKSNLLAAIAFCSSHDIDISFLASFASKISAVAGRMELITLDNYSIPKIIVDFAHTPDALENVLLSLKSYKPKRLFCIVGCGGDRDKTKRSLMLQACLQHSDIVIITQDNPRTEDPNQIVADMLAGKKLDEQIILELDRAVAISNAVNMADEGDIVLIAGKGHENYQIIGTTKHPFSDQIIARQALEERQKNANDVT